MFVGSRLGDSILIRYTPTITTAVAIATQAVDNPISTDVDLALIDDDLYADDEDFQNKRRKLANSASKKSAEAKGESLERKTAKTSKSSKWKSTAAGLGLQIGGGQANGKALDEMDDIFFDNMLYLEDDADSVDKANYASFTFEVADHLPNIAPISLLQL